MKSKMKSAIAVFALVLCLLGLVSGLTRTEWASYKAKHAKKYPNEVVEAMRREIFEETKRKVEHHNEHLSEKVGYKLGINHMSDWTQEEKDKLNGARVPTDRMQGRKLPPLASKRLAEILKEPQDLPSKVDWRKVDGRVTSVKNQKFCGSCWAFSTVGVLEGQEVHMKLNLTSLSPQQLVDCNKVNNGCDGGYPLNALDYVNDNGIDTEKSYPYEGTEGTCRASRDGVVEQNNVGARLPEDNKALKVALFNYGPISVLMEATEDMHDYQSGVFRTDTCKRQLNHAVLLVGYDTTEEGNEYWILKNSWSKDWGEEGYIRFAMNQTECGIEMAAVVTFLY